MRRERRKTWRNHTGNQRVAPLQICRPETVDDVVSLVREAEESRSTVRAVGSGHSWSDVALCRGFLVETQGLGRELDLRADLLRQEADANALIRVEAGMRIRELNAALARGGRALSNMGGYDGQTVAGVISTSTHGSGIGFGPLSSFVRSLELVASEGRLFRIEPADGPTDPERHEERSPGWTLVQDDHWFRAAMVGMGCLGLIHAATLAVEPAYLLTEVRRPKPWSEVADDLREGTVLRDNRHYEVYLNPHRREGRNLCMVTTRNPAEPDDRGEPSRRRNSMPEFLAMLPITPIVARTLVNLRPSLSPYLVDRALSALADEEYTSASYKVLNIGTANLLPAYSAEIALPIDDDQSHIRAVERILEVAERHARLGSVYHTSPIALRFVRASDAYMSMMEGRDTMMIELIQMTGTEGGVELLAVYEEALDELGARPHWGQLNNLTPDRVRSSYPHFGDWLDVQRQLNRTGVFDSPFARRVGIEKVG